MGGVGTFLFRDALVRWGVQRFASAHKLDVSFGHARIGVFEVTLENVRVRPVGATGGAAGVQFIAEQLDVPFSRQLRPESLVLRNGSLTLTGSVHDLEREIEPLFHRGDGSPPVPNGERRVPIVANFAVHWLPSEGAAPTMEAGAITLERTADETKVSVLRFSATHDALHLESPSISATLDRANTLTALTIPHLDVVVGGELLKKEEASATSAPSPTLAGKGAPAEPQHPLTREQKVAAMLAEVGAHLADGALVDVGSLSLNLERESGGLRFAEGHLTASREGETLRAKYSSGAGSKSLAVGLTAPFSGGNIRIDLEGGPISLASLGVINGAFGLTRVDEANLLGKGEFVIDPSSDSVAFDASLEAENVSVDAVRFAKDPVTGIHLQLVARGLAKGVHDVRIDNASIALGALRLAFDGTISRDGDHLAITLHGSAPPIDCQDLLASIPPTLVPLLDGVELKGSFSASGKLEVDSKNLDGLVLESDVKDGCEATVVPPELARERFEAPFDHRIYQADGGVGEERMGPGTDSWQPLESVSPYMEVAVRTTEDGGFPRHHGWSGAAMRGALIANLKAGRFVRGASTISMQLAKNLFLTREKTLGRKLEELLLTDYLEKTFTKRELMELYLNIVEFGPDVYGVTQAAAYYFGRTPAELTLGECMFLATMLPSPLRLSAVRKEGALPERSWKTIVSLVKTAHRVGLVSATEEASAMGERIVFFDGTTKPAARAAVKRPADAPHMDHGEEADLDRDPILPN